MNMQKRSKQAFVVIAILAIMLALFFGWMIFILGRASNLDNLPIATTFPFGLELSELLPLNYVGAVSQDFVDLDADGQKELVIGFGMPNGSSLSASSIVPHLRVFKKIGNDWRVVSEFAFAALPEQNFANASNWHFSGVPSFERKDIDGDHREELFVRLDIGNDFFRAITIVVWRGGTLTWLPLEDEGGRPLIPAFLEGGTTSESRRLIIEDASQGGGLDLISAHGRLDAGTGFEKWTYDVFVEGGGIYRYDRALSTAITSSGRPLSE